MDPHARLAEIAAPATPADHLARLRQLLLAMVRAEDARQGRRAADLSQGLRLLAYERQLPAALATRLHTLRRTANLVLHESYPGTAAEAGAGFVALVELVEILTETPYVGPRLFAPDAASEVSADAIFAHALPRPATAEANWRVHILNTDPATGELLAEAETPGAGGAPSEAFRVRVPEAFVGILAAAGRLRGRALLLGAAVLQNAAEAEGGQVVATCQRLILEPDYLISVTTVADCMDWKQALPDWALQKAFQPETSTRSMVLGNLVNQLLDEEVSHAARHGETLTASLFTSAAEKQEIAESDNEQPEANNQQPRASNQQPATSNQQPETSFDLEDFFRRRLFALNALPLSTMPEFETAPQIRELLDDLRRHHRTLRETREQGFAAASQTGFTQTRLNMADCFLEPSFLSATYGLQGRLDLLHESPTGHDIIELKSAKSVPGGVPWASHVAQAQLYRLLLGSAFGEGESTRGRTSILYSAAAGGGTAVRPVLRDAPLVDAILACRNQLVATELLLAQSRGPRETAALLAPVFRPDPKQVPTYARDKANEVAQAWNRADKVEKNYCLELVRFGARELRMGLLGNDTRPGDAGGQAGLWRLSKSRKEQNFTLLDGLTLLENHADADNDARDGLGPHLVFQRPAHAAEVNFRAGDSLLLYPRQKAPVAPSLSLARAEIEEEAPANDLLIHSSTHSLILSPLDAQVVKVTLAEDLTPDGRIVLSLRNRRIAPRYLSQHSHWALEPDTYDTVRREWAALTRFLLLPPARRQCLLARTTAGPRVPENWPADSLPATDAATVVARALAAPDWFVLCGPPGTGKTRMVLRELALNLHGLSQQTLLAAYTNRAVDEICEQLIDAGLPFIRIGSRLGTAPDYRKYLLDNMMADRHSRRAVRDCLENMPIFVGTITSLLTKPELFALKKFDVVVVDEASQVLEASMLALLGQVPKFILIGDHRQLPAVVVQDPQDSAIAPECADLLREHLGLTNLRNSYFERLFRRAEAHWPHAHGTLADQHRSHQELADLVNDDFYGGQLRCPSPWQSEVLCRVHWPAPAPDDALALALHTRRVVFVPTRRQPEDLSMKESAHEADLAARAAVLVVRGEGASFDPATGLGIIASYRNQAARIRARLAQLAEELSLPALAQISVDTVERYQGSQREVIIVSFCCHHEHQLDLLVSPDETGLVDRKLNVALTRARQQLVLLGNEEILAGAPHHATLLRRVPGTEIAFKARVSGSVPHTEITSP